MAQKNKKLRVAIIAHDNQKETLLEWVRENRAWFAKHQLYATGTTGGLVKSRTGLKVHCFKSGPLGGDLQIGAMIVEEGVDFVIFFWDPMEPHPHDPDVKALLRIAALYDIPIACNLATAECVIRSNFLFEARRQNRRGGKNIHN